MKRICSIILSVAIIFSCCISVCANSTDKLYNCEDLLYGDVNQDGRINTSDCSSLICYLVHDRLIDEIASDVNDDGYLDVRDLVRLSRYVSGEQCALGATVCDDTDSVGFDQVYISSQGNDTNIGLIDSPVLTLTRAEQLVRPNGRIIVLDQCTIGGDTYSGFNKPVRISGGQLQLSANSIIFNSDVTFEDITLCGNDSSIYVSGNRFEIKKDVLFDNSLSLTVFGSDSNGQSTGAQVLIETGKYADINVSDSLLYFKGGDISGHIFGGRAVLLFNDLYSKLSEKISSVNQPHQILDVHAGVSASVSGNILTTDAQIVKGSVQYNSANTCYELDYTKTANLITLAKNDCDKNTGNNVFHDESSLFVSPLEPMLSDTVTYRLRVPRNASLTNISLQWTTSGGIYTIKMVFDGYDTSGYYSYYKATKKLSEITSLPQFILKYWFSFQQNGTTYYYKRSGLTTTRPNYSDSEIFKTYVGFKTPDWAKGALYYSIMPDAFYNGDTTNDVQSGGLVTNTVWGNSHSGQYDRYGGDLTGIKKKLDYIKGLGATALFINPIWKSEQNAGYGPYDFDQIDSSLGNLSLFKSLVNGLHSRKISLMLDSVLYYAPENGKWYNKDGYYPISGAAQSSGGAYSSLFSIATQNKWGIQIDLDDDNAKNILYKQSNSILQRYTRYGVDGWRFDCGGDLWGSVSSNIDIAKDIRSSIKGTDENTLILAEAGSVSNFSWEGKWNLPMIPLFRSWANASSVISEDDITSVRAVLGTDYSGGMTEESDIMEGLKRTILNNPRQTGLTTYNILSDHDTDRFTTKDFYAYQSALLLLMTYPGSPSVFYGEETGADYSGSDSASRNCSFNSFNWNENEWNTNTYNLYRALGQLRTKFDSLKDGSIAVSTVDDDSNVIIFGRWNSNNSVVTVCNRNSSDITLDISVCEYGFADGDTVTDWLTGQQYQVENGQIHATVMPGGSAFVRSEESYGCRDAFSISEISGTTAQVSGYNGSYSYSSQGRIGAYSDKIAFVNKPATGNANLAAKANDGVSLMVRSSLTSNSAFYSATVDDGELIVKSRQANSKVSKTILSAEISNDSTIVIKRNGAEFTTYILGANGYESIMPNSSCRVDMNATAYYGFFGLDGEIHVNDFSVREVNGVLFDTFEQNVRLFNSLEELPYTIKNNSLIVKADNNEVVRSIPMLSDFTVKSSIGSIYGNSELPIGTAIICDDDNFIVAGRNNGRLLFGTMLNGEFIVYDSVLDQNPKKDIIMQVQKSGSNYTAAYSYDGENFTLFNGDITANYSEVCGGLYVPSGIKAYYNYFSYGDAISSSSVYRAVSPVGLDLSDSHFGNRPLAYAVSGDDSVEFSQDGVTMKNLGEQQTNVLGIGDKSLENFRAEATIQFSSTPNGHFGFEFGRSAKNAGLYYAPRLQYISMTGDLYIVADNEIKQNVSVNSNTMSIRLAVECVDGCIKVYVNDSIKPVMQASNISHNGFFCFYTVGNEATFTEYRLYEWASTEETFNTPIAKRIKSENLHHYEETLSPKLKAIFGEDAVSYCEEGITLKNRGEFVTNILSVANRSYKNFRVESTVDFTASPNSHFGFEFGRSVENAPLYYAPRLQFNTETNMMYIVSDNEIQASFSISQFNGPTRIVLECIEGDVRVYLGDYAVPILEAEEISHQGFFCFYTVGVEASFMNYNIYEIDGSVEEIYGNLYAEGNTISLDTLNGNYNYALAGIRDAFATNALIYGEISVESIDGNAANGGILLSGAYGRTSELSGYYVELDTNGVLSLKSDDRILGQASGFITHNLPILIIAQNGIYNVYADGNHIPCITYDTHNLNGGCVQIQAFNANFSVRNLTITELRNGFSHQNSQLIQGWLAGSCFTDNTENYYDNFTNELLSLRYLYPYKGTWKIENECVSLTQASLTENTENDYWNNGIAIMRAFDEFEMSFSLKTSPNEHSWAAIEIGKSTPAQTHRTSHLSVLFSPNGYVQFLDGSTVSSICSNYVGADLVSNYADFVIRVKDNTVSLIYGETTVLETEYTSYHAGFISLNYGSDTAENAECSYKNVRIEAIN